VVDVSYKDIIKYARTVPLSPKKRNRTRRDMRIRKGLGRKQAVMSLTPPYMHDYCCFLIAAEVSFSNAA